MSDVGFFNILLLKMLVFEDFVVLKLRTFFKGLTLS